MSSPAPALEDEDNPVMRDALVDPETDQVDWSADPMRILEQLELDSGFNVFGFLID